MVLPIFSVCLFAFSLSSEWVIAEKTHAVCDGLKYDDKDQSEDDVAIDQSKGITKCHPAFVWVAKKPGCGQSKNQAWNSYPKCPGSKSMASDSGEYPPYQDWESKSNE